LREWENKPSSPSPFSQSRRRGAGNIEVSKSLCPLGRGIRVRVMIHARGLLGRARVKLNKYLQVLGFLRQPKLIYLS